jgi:hypothetical protein
MPAKIHRRILHSLGQLRECARHSQTAISPTTCQRNRRPFSSVHFECVATSWRSESYFFRLIEFLNVVLCRRFQSSCRSESMKPRSPSTGGKGHFPQTDYFFHSGFGQWRGNFWSSDGEDRSRFRNLFNLGREYRIEAARERAREMAVFAVIVLTSAWPVIYMIVTVVRLLSKGRPLN